MDAEESGPTDLI